MTCQPNIGTVGLTEEQALENGHKGVIFESRFKPMKLTLTQSSEQTLMKLVVDADTDRVLGAHMVAARHSVTDPTLHIASACLGNPMEISAASNTNALDIHKHAPSP